MGLRPSSSNLTCSHQQFVDDTMLMGRSTIIEDKNLNRIMDEYERACS